MHKKREHTSYNINFRVKKKKPLYDDHFGKIKTEQKHFII